MLPFQPPFSNQDQVRCSSDPSLNRFPSSSNNLPNQLGFTNPHIMMPTMGDINNQNALLNTLLAQQQLIQGLQNNLMSALSQQGLIPQFHGQQINLLGGLQNPNPMSLQQSGLLGRPPSTQNLNPAMGCLPNGFLCSQNPNFSPNPQLPVMNSGNPNPAFLGNGNPQVVRGMNNSPRLETQLSRQNLKEPVLTSPVQNNQSSGRQWLQNLQEPMLTSPVQNNQSSGRQWLQMTNNQAVGKNFSSNSSKNVPINNFKTRFNGSGRMDPSHMRFQNPQSYNSRNTCKKEGSFPRNDRGQRQRNERNTILKGNNNNASILRKRPLALIYNESEVQQWREARKKNFPTRVNMDKKLSAKEDTDFDANTLRQQLKEVLAKQAELGVQVAEIPSFYLTESEEHASGNINSNESSNLNTQTPHNNFNNKRGRSRRDNWNAKRRKFKGDASRAHEPVVKKREPTLLRKLLNADIRKDKSQLLQAFRFMVLNSFFKNSSEKPLVFPIITVKDADTPVSEVMVAEKLSRSDVVLQDTATPNSNSIVASAKELTQNDQMFATTIGNVGNDEEEIESDSDDIVGASDLVCDAVGDDFAAGDETSEEGEITD